jgi:hypothetical protein
MKGASVKGYLDANVFDWIVDSPGGTALLSLIEAGVLTPVVAADTAHELHRIPAGKDERRVRLQTLLMSHFVPVAPTHVPIAGIARAGLARISTPYVMGLRDRLKDAGIVGLDSNHLINAAREGCTQFISLDKGLLRKAVVIIQILGLECTEPGEIVRRLSANVEHGAG